MAGSRTVACLLALVVAAGCLGGLDGDGGTTRDPYGVPSEDSGLAESDATEGTPTTTTTYPRTPASYAFRHVAENHGETLRSVGNFTLRVEFMTEGPNASSRSFVARVDLSADRYRLDRGLYRNETGVYRLDGGENGTPGQVDVDPTPRELVLDALGIVENRSIRFPFQRAGTTTLHGAEVSRYVADDPGRYRGQDGRVDAVTAFSATAAFDDRTIVRRFEYVLRGVLGSGDRYVERFEVTITGVGNTTVRPPGEARNGTGVG